jgi:FMN reductase
MFLVISCSLRPDSRSRVLARLAYSHLRTMGDEVTYLDLAGYALPLCDDHDCYDHEHTRRVRAEIATATGVVLAAPIYNYDVSAATKNLVELTGEAWTDKVVGFLCAAGGRSSYMSVMGLANSLMLDFRCVILPRFVYATDATFIDGRVHDPRVEERIAELTRMLARITGALQQPFA